MRTPRIIAGSAAFAVAGSLAFAGTAFAAPIYPSFAFGQDQYSYDEATDGQIELTIAIPDGFYDQDPPVFGVPGSDAFVAVADGSDEKVDVIEDWGAQINPIDTPDENGYTAKVVFDEVPEGFTGTLTISLQLELGEEQPSEPTTPPADEPTTDPTPENTTPPAEGPEGSEGDGSGDETVLPEDEDETIELTSFDAAPFTAKNAQAAEPVTISATTRIGDAPVAPAERELTVDPQEIPAADFVDEDKGVTIVASGFDTDEVVTLEVAAGPESVTGTTIEELADENGDATFVVYGTNASQPQVYVGDYELVATGADDTDDEAPLTGGFTVTSGSGSDSGSAGGDTSTGGSLPRTGAELGALGAGLALLIGGGAMIAFTARRRSEA